LLSFVIGEPAPSGEETPITSRTRKISISNHPVASEAENAELLQDINGANLTAAVLQTFPNYCDAFVVNGSSPLIQSDLYKPSNADWSNEELLKECSIMYDKVVGSITTEQIQNAEEKSRDQSKSNFWYDVWATDWVNL